MSNKAFSRRNFIKTSTLGTTTLATVLPALGNALQAQDLNLTQHFTHTSTDSYDLVICGGTPAGIMAGIAASRLGYNSVILERTTHVGGLPANGLGATDIGTRGGTGGLFLEFVNRIKAYYIKQYGADSKQVKDCSDGYHFEPSVGEKILEQMLAEHPKVKVLKNIQFDAEPENVKMKDGIIEEITTLNRITGQKETFKGKIFLDATYEGDLLAAANVPYFMGREGKDDLNEHGAGRAYKYWGGPEGPGSNFQRDNALQAYNYRLCLTNNPANRVEIKLPANYNRAEFVSLVDDVRTGNHTGYNRTQMTAEQKAENEKRIKQGLQPMVPGMPEGIAYITNRVRLPNEKTDSNNQHLAFISTDLPEENWPWPTSGWDWRDRFAIRLKEYTLGLLYFAQNDPELPAWFKEKTKEWGLTKDEYQDNENFPRQVYVREGRRMDGVHFFTAHDATSTTEDGRPPILSSSVTASHYAIDSHAVRKREPGRVHLDGFVSYHVKPYNVPYGVMVPKKVKNLLVPVSVSASHLGFGTIRMEPCWMALGQAAGVAASFAIQDQVPVQNVSVTKLQKELVKQKAILIYYRDVPPTHAAFDAVQFFGVRGFLPEWTINPDEKVNADEIKRWSKLTGLSAGKQIVAGTSTRAEMLQALYAQALKLPENKLKRLKA